MVRNYTAVGHDGSSLFDAETRRHAHLHGRLTLIMALGTIRGLVCAT